MKICIENCSSPGASFTNNTNEVVEHIYDWIIEKNYPKLMFIDFRKNLQRDKKINDNNARNIYPLLKKCGFIVYEKSEELDTSSFFTNYGLAYIKLIKTKKLVETNKNDFNNWLKVIEKLNESIQDLVYIGLDNLLKAESNYSLYLKSVIKYICLYGKINKYEYAYLLYFLKDKDSDLKDMNDIVQDYRNGNITFDISVTVRNDIQIREKTNTEKRDEGLGFLTSYSFFSSLLSQSGVVVKTKEYFVMNPEKKEKLLKLLEN